VVEEGPDVGGVEEAALRRRGWVVSWKRTKRTIHRTYARSV
jgi:hypothetical protein